MFDAQVHRVLMASPADVSEAARLFEGGAVDPADVVAILAQTEGDGYARGYAAQSFEVLFSERLKITREEVGQRIPMLMIGGTAGLMTPHATLFVKKRVTGRPPGGKRLALGVRSSRVLLPEEYGTMIQVEVVAATVREALADAEITDPKDVHCVEVKCPAMTPARVQDARRRGQPVVNANPAAASSMAKGASALGVALALGEVGPDRLGDGVICRDFGLYSAVASTSAGGEQVGCRAVVIGNATASGSALVAGHGVMRDQLDLAGAYRAFEGAGLRVEAGAVAAADQPRVQAVFVNAGADFAPDVRGRRHTMPSDFLWSFAGWQAKAVAHAVVSAIVGDTLVLASAGAEHQGPPGANLVCVIARA
ncbi:MAG: ring-opening amidohydrolase [Candidatus Rokuibacteriota bacterium]